MPVASSAFFLPHLVFIQPWICTVIQSNALEQRWRRREKRGGNAITCVTSQVALNFCVNLHCNLNPDTGCLLNKQYKPSILFCGLFQLSDFFFLKDGWIALDFLYYHFFSAFTVRQRVKRPFRSSLDATPCITRKLPAQWKQLERGAVTQLQA